MYNYLTKFYISANCAFFDNTDYRTNNNENPHYVEILNHQKIDISTEAGRKELREKAIEYLNSLKGTQVQCPILEKEFGKNIMITFGRIGIKKTISFSASVEKLIAIFQIKNIIKTANSYKIVPNVKQEKKPGVKRYINLFNKITILNKVRNVKVYVEEKHNGQFYYEMILNNANYLDNTQKNICYGIACPTRQIRGVPTADEYNITNYFDDVNSFLNLFNDMQLDKNSIIVLDCCEKKADLGKLLPAKRIRLPSQIGDYNITNYFDDVNSFLNLFFENEFCCK